MRFLHSFLLALGCFALVLQSNAADIPAKQTHAATEYRAAAGSIPDEALNDYHYSSTFCIRNNTAVKSFHETAIYFTGYAGQHITGYIINDFFHNISILLAEAHAKVFRGKLIFPRHYHW